MKELKAKRESLQLLVKIASNGTHIICICASQRHIKAFTGAIVKVMFEEQTLPWGVGHNEITTTITTGDGIITLLQSESYDPANHTEGHKVVKII